MCFFVRSTWRIDTKLNYNITFVFCFVELRLLYDPWGWGGLGLQCMPQGFPSTPLCVGCRFDCDDQVVNITIFFDVLHTNSRLIDDHTHLLIATLC